MTRTMLSIAAQIVGAVVLALAVPIVGRALGEMASSLVAATTIGF